jgi:hypothetical protein
MTVTRPGAGFTDPSPLAAMDAATRQLGAQVRAATVELNAYQAILSQALGEQNR